MEYIIYPTNVKISLPSRGYFKKGDKGTPIMIISSFLACNFMGYEPKTGVKIKDMLGEYYGNNLEVWIREFQRNNGLEPDGNIGSPDLAKLREFGMNA